MAYSSYYMDSLSYGTTATSLNIKDCDAIQKPVVNAILPKMGVNRHTANTVVFGTRKYGGLGLDHLATVQGFVQLQYLIRSSRTQDTTGDMYQMLLEYTQLEYGTNTPILEAEFTRYEPTILTKNCITECWRYLSLCKSTVVITGLSAPTKARKGDIALMDDFTTQFMMDAHMKDVNTCRIYLKVFHTSDITDLAGNTIEEWSKQGKRQSNRTSKWNWPVQQRPPAEARKNWAIALQGIASDDGDLYSSLGRGRRHHSRIRRKSGIWTQRHFHYSDTMKDYGRSTKPYIMGASGLNSWERQHQNHGILLTRPTASNGEGTSN
jgi:hypothetical protein